MSVLPAPLPHHHVHCFSEGSRMITWRCYYPSSNFHKHVWLTADCPHSRLDLKQENNEQNITWLVIRENVSGEDISGKVHSVLLLPTVYSDKFGKWYMKFRWVNMPDLYRTLLQLISLHIFASRLFPALVMLLSVYISHPFNRGESNVKISLPLFRAHAVPICI